MRFEKLFLTENDCYKAGKKIKPKGIMLHSTGANNPKLSRYIQPDDGILGDNPNNNDWNRPGIKKCVHAFIGLDKNDEVRTYRTLDWEHRGWGGGGKSNDTHIHIEICEGDLDDAEYFEKVYKEAVEVSAHLCKRFDLDVEAVITHSEGHKLGIASNHADVMHWFPKHGKSMDTLRADVKRLLDADKPKHVVTTEMVKEALSPPAAKSISQLADEVMRGVHGSGRERMLSLGTNYAAVQMEVNRRLRSK